MKKIISSFFSSEKFERAFKTFLEAFFSYITLNIINTNINSKSAVTALILGAIASSFSYLLNYNKGGNKDVKYKR